MELFAHFLGRLRDTTDGDGSLLDRVTIVYGSGISDGDKHAHDDLPVLVAGGGNGAWGGGRHVACDAGTPMSNLYVTVLDRLGIPQDTIGDSTGEIGQLLAV